MRWFRFRSRIVIEPSVPIFESDARRQDGPRARDAASAPGERAPSRLRSRARILIWYAVFCFGAIAALVGQGGYIDLMRGRAERDQAFRRLEQQRSAVEVQREAIQSLRSDPLARERIAREQLGLAPPGEVQFLLPRVPDDRVPLAPAPEVDPDAEGHEDRSLMPAPDLLE